MKNSLLKSLRRVETRRKQKELEKNTYAAMYLKNAYSLLHTRIITVVSR